MVTPPFQCVAAHTSPGPVRVPTVQMSSGATAEAACGTSGEGTRSHRRPVNRATQGREDAEDGWKISPNAHASVRLNTAAAYVRT
jgi:hypothetical protein